MYFAFKRFILTSCITLFFLMGCVSAPTPNVPLLSKNRQVDIQTIKQWKIRGKIAFIQRYENQKDKRESASLNWQVDEITPSQSLNLTSYLGMNVLSISSQKHSHTIKVDGKTYHSTNLKQLIYSLTGLTIPTNALTYWLKGLPYRKDDQVIYQETTQLPKSIHSTLQQENWLINFSQYKTFQQIPMATKITLIKDNLTIKISIQKWQLTHEH